MGWNRLKENEKQLWHFRFGYNIFLGGHFNGYLSMFVRFTHLFPTKDKVLDTRNIKYGHKIIVSLNIVIGFNNNKKSVFKAGLIGGIGYNRDYCVLWPQKFHKKREPK